MTPEPMSFLVGIPEPSWAHRFEEVFISIARLRRRKAAFLPPRRRWAMDSAGFTEVALNGGYQTSPATFAEEAADWVTRVPGCCFVASQDFMCEPFVLAKTGLTVPEHQRLTVDRFDAISARWAQLVGDGPPILPVLQGYMPDEYLRHLEDYGDRIGHGAWVGVGSVCKRQGNISLIRELLGAIKRERPDLRLHGFGVKITALQDPLIREQLFSADSMAWSFEARKVGQRERQLTGSTQRSPNNWREAQAFVERVAAPPRGHLQPSLFG